MRKKALIDNIYRQIIEGFSPMLTYHGVHHTRDVHNVCLFYIDHYGISEKEGELLEIGAATHDIGFMHTYRNHEEVSCVMAEKLMRQYEYSQNEIEIVKEMIMATKIPQNPKSFLAEILCDADLDYLGREDFGDISATLKEEWKNYRIFENIDEQFDHIQIPFLKIHKYHTSFAKENRTPVMLQHLRKLEEKVL